MPAETMTPRREKFLPRTPLYAILDTGYVAEENAERVTQSLLAGGAGVLQLRAKGWEAERVAGLAARLLPLCRDAGVPFIVNDFPEVARDVGADGVHLGQDDGTLATARAIVGPDRLLGRSTHSLAQALAAAEEGFDYIGFGPLYPTGTKPGRPAIGLDDLGAATRQAACPVFAIGGVNVKTLPAVLEAGARHVVIVSALLTAPDVVTATRKAIVVLTRTLQEY